MRRTALLGAVVLASCGGSHQAPVPSTGVAPPPVGRPAVPTVPNTRPPTDDEVRRGLHLPHRVPLHATGKAPAAQARVVRRWLDDLRAGHVGAAAKLFSLPARFQNFSTLAIITTPKQALAVTTSLPCGAKPTELGGAHGWVVYEAELTSRPGGACGTGVGAVVRGAVLVRDGRMIEWYRLPDKTTTSARPADETAA